MVRWAPLNVPWSRRLQTCTYDLLKILEVNCGSLEKVLRLIINPAGASGCGLLGFIEPLGPGASLIDALRYAPPNHVARPRALCPMVPLYSPTRVPSECWRVGHRH